MAEAIGFFKAVRNVVKYWYVQFIAGLIFVAVGIWVFMTPAESYLALSILFSISFLVTGLTDTIFSVSNRKELDNWGWTLALGIMNLVIGFILIIRPEISMVTLPFFVGFVVLYRSLMAVSLSFELKNYGIMEWGSLLALGILGVIFAFILLWNPAFAGLSLVVWTALAFITVGIFTIIFSLKLKKLHDIPAKISSTLKTRWEEVQNQIANELDKGVRELAKGMDEVSKNIAESSKDVPEK